jgi:hypothetical protein
MAETAIDRRLGMLGYLCYLRCYKALKHREGSMAIKASIARSVTCAAAVFAALMLTATEGNAQQIDPRCSKMRDPLGCTCALQNGGYIIYGPPPRWASARGTNGGRATNQAFTQCLIRHGRV